MKVLPSITDRYRTLRNGDKKYVGQVLLLDGGKLRVIAQVFGKTVEEMRRRKRAVEKALEESEK